MKYLVFYHEVPEHVSYFITEDSSFVSLHGVFINGHSSQEDIDKLSDLLFDKDGDLKIKTVDSLKSKPMEIDGPFTVLHVGFIL